MDVFPDKPDAPGKPDVVDLMATSARITWLPPDNDGGAPITNYVIEYRRAGDKKWIEFKTDVTDTDLLVESLKEETEHEFRVAAQNKAGVGPFSPPSEPRKFGMFSI